MRRSLLLAFSIFGFAYAQERVIDIRVRDTLLESNRPEIPIMKKKKAQTETTVKELELKTRAGAGSTNVFKAVELTPSLNIQTDDPYGLGGGSIRLRGFDDRQIAISIDGMPLSDSGNFALYPHEYIDIENVEIITIQRGAVDKRSPFYVDLGGSVNIRTRPPRDKRGFEFSASYGSNAFRRFFLRADSGLIKDLNLKAFLSFSSTQADKWRGPGMHPAYRDHTAIGLSQNFKRVRYEFYFDNNAQLNYFYRGLNFAQISNLSANRKLDYTPSLIRVGDGLSYAPNEPAFQNNALYYKFFQNPYDNQEYRANIDIDITRSVSLNLKPYAWVGRGSGTSAVTTTSGGRSFIFFRESFNYTDRPGVVAELSYDIPSGKVYLGYWYERSDLKQWQPQRPVRVLPDGSFEVLAPTSGTPAFQYNYIQRTFTTTNTPYIFAELEDIFGFDINLGLRYANVKRDFKNYLTSNLPYLPEDSIYDQPLTLDPRLSYKKTYTKLLPNFGISYELNKKTQIYFAYAKNFRIPVNFLGTIPATLNAQFVADQLKPEESDSFDLGLRLDLDKYYISPSIYLVDYKNRIISTADPSDPTLIYQRNAGKVSASGAELELGSKPFENLSIYGSISYNKAKFKDENFFDGTTRISIKDKTLPDTPELMFKLGAHLRLYDFDIKPALQYVSSRYGNFTNTEKVPSYTILDMRIEREFYKRSFNAFFDVKNLFDKKYVGRISAGTRSGVYFPGAPLSLAVGLRGRF